MRSFQHKSVKKSRKRKRCDWCSETINIGQPYHSYRLVTFGDAGTVRMHPECLQASCDVAKQEGGRFEWNRGDFRRGSTEQR